MLDNVDFKASYFTYPSAVLQFCTADRANVDNVDSDNSKRADFLLQTYLKRQYLLVTYLMRIMCSGVVGRLGYRSFLVDTRPSGVQKST